MSLSVDNLIGVQPTTTSSSALTAQQLDIYNGTTNFHRITSNSVSPLLGITIPNASGTMTLNTATQTLTNKMNHAQVGSVTDPSYSFVGDTDTGFYRLSPGIIGATCDSVQVLTLSSTEHSTNGIALRIPNGTPGSISALRFGSFNNTYGIGGDSNGVFINNATIRVCRFGSTGLIVDNDAALRVEAPRYRVTTGASNTASSPAYSFQDETNSGMYRFTSSDIRISVGSSDKFSFGSSTNTTLQALHLQNGTATAPSVAFQSESNTGIYRVALNDMGFTVGGSVRFRLSTGNITTSLIYSSTNAGSVSNPSIQVGSSSYGLYQTGSTLSVAVSSTQVASWETGGMKLYNSVGSYSPSNLNYYEEATINPFTFNFGTNTVNGVLSITRIGRIVTVSLDNDVVQTPNTSISTITTNNQIPTRFLPTTTRKLLGSVIVEPAGSLKIFYFAQVNTNGSMAFIHPQGNLYGSSTTLYSFIASWSVTP